MDIREELRNLENLINSISYPKDIYCNIHVKIMQIIEELLVQQTVQDTRLNMQLEKIQRLSAPPNPQEELKPCPFCRSSNICGYKHAEGFMKTCENCGAATDYYVFEKHAAVAWDRRDG